MMIEFKGDADELEEQLRAYADAGVERVMLQHLQHEDVERVAVLGEVARVYASRVRVFLVRHAEAAPGEPDELRRLTSAGRDAAGRSASSCRRTPDRRRLEPAAARERDRRPDRARLQARGDRRRGLAPGATTETLRDAAADGARPSSRSVTTRLQRDRLRADRPRISFPPAGVAELEL